MDDMKFLAACEIIRCWNQWPPARVRRWLGGRRLGLLLIAGLLPLSAAAVECSESRPEHFAEFFKTFASDTRFAVARTVLPLLTERWSDDDWFDELAEPADVWITPEDYARRPSLQSRSTAQHLVLQVTFLGSTAATVELLGPQHAALEALHFKLDSGCWKLSKVDEFVTW